jgi:hypothetical protein
VTTPEVLTLTGQAVVLAGAVLGYLATRRSVGRVRDDVGQVRDDVGQVHELVNNRSDRQDQRIEQLSGTLTDAGVDVPGAPGAPG